jgi:molybdopterin synthase sulfur carrier subunit
MLTEITGAESHQVPFVDNTETLLHQLFQQWPALRSIPFQVAVNLHIIQEPQPLQPGMEIALLPPFSGG